MVSSKGQFLAQPWLVDLVASVYQLSTSHPSAFFSTELVPLWNLFVWRKKSRKWLYDRLKMGHSGGKDGALNSPLLPFRSAVKAQTLSLVPVAAGLLFFSSSDVFLRKVFDFDLFSADLLDE